MEHTKLFLPYKTMYFTDIQQQLNIILEERLSWMQLTLLKETTTA